MFTETEEFRHKSHYKQVKCICSCGKESWVRVYRDGSLEYDKCHKCASELRTRSKPTDTHRICKRCNKNKPVNEFVKSKTQKYLCLVCKRTEEAKKYAANPEKTQARIAKKYLEQRAFMNDLKDKPCIDCEFKFTPCQMDFDHRDPSIKVKSLSHMFHWAQEKILAEISKCDLVCANCHRDRTQKIVEFKYKTPGHGGGKLLREVYTPKWQDIPLNGPGKTCSKCGKEKNSLNFAPRGAGELRGQCRMCVGERHHNLGRENIERLRKQRLERSNKMAAWFESIKDNQFCKDCGVSHRHWRLDFDHLDGKIYKPSRLKNSLHSRETVLAEISKCDLICANCHRLRTWNRMRERRAGPT